VEVVCTQAAHFHVIAVLVRLEMPAYSLPVEYMRVVVVVVVVVGHMRVVQKLLLYRSCRKMCVLR